MNNQNPKSVLNQTQYYEPDFNKRSSFITNEDYFSLLCRNGPLPQKYHKQTDFFCTVLYLITLTLMIVLVIFNGLSGDNFTYEKQQDLKKDLLYGQRFFLWEMIFAGSGLIILSMFMTILALFIPKVMSFFSIIMLTVLCGLFTFIQIHRFLSQQTTIFLYLFKALISIVILVILLGIIVRRRQKIINLGIFLELSSKVIRPHICLIYTQMILLSIFQLIVWYGFANLYYGVATVKQIDHPLLNSLTKLIVVIVWLWTSGALIALSDYVVAAYSVHWFYDLSKIEDLQEVRNIDRQTFENGDREIYQQHHQQFNPKYKPQIFRPVYKKLCSHIGTIIFGSILSYLPLYLISKIQKLIFKSTTKQPTVVTLSKYGYLDTIMQWQGFMNANHRIYKLRKRIKSVMPQLYMLGHIYGDFTKLSLLLIGLAIIHQLVELKSDIAHHGEYWLQYSFTVLFFAIGVGLQIVTNFTNLIGKCGDILFFLYCIDLEIERVHFARNATYSTPRSLWQIIKKLTIKRTWKTQK